jgi:Fe-S-cluster containining protein
MNMLTKEEQAALAHGTESVRKIAFQGLSKLTTASEKINFIGNLQRGVDQIQAVAQHDTHAGVPERVVACRAGCSHCCEVRVEALAPEVFQIANALKQLPEQALAGWRQRLQAHVPLVRNLTTAEHRAPCVFLRDHLCAIYGIRPAVCRRAHSYDATACAEHHPEIPQNLQVILQAEALLKGTVDAYAQDGLHAGGHELSQAVLMALDDDTLEVKWLNGGQDC